ncbi:hypothetical protein P9112_009191 [Eukaryota sp. TZLM1-RC]
MLMADVSRISAELIKDAEGEKPKHLFIYNVFPIETSLSPTYMQVETEKFDEPQESDDETIDVDETKILNLEKVLNKQHCVMTKNTNGYFFDGSILTDGCGVSVQHKRNDLKKCKDKQLEKDELYNHDICENELNSLKCKVIAEVDPNQYDAKLV